jgi:hypothetical protein
MEVHRVSLTDTEHLSVQYTYNTTSINGCKDGQHFDSFSSIFVTQMDQFTRVSKLNFHELRG